MSIGVLIAVIAIFNGGNVRGAQEGAREVASLVAREKRVALKGIQAIRINTKESTMRKEDPEVENMLHEIKSRKVYTRVPWKRNIIIPDGRAIDEEMYWDFVQEAYEHEDEITLTWLHKQVFINPITMLLTAELYEKRLAKQKRIIIKANGE